MKNFEVANLLYKIADILEMQNVQWKPQAYRRAAQSIENMSEDIEVLYKQGKLKEIPGVGKAIAEKISEYLATGKLRYYEKLKKKLPVKLDELMSVPGLGPKKIMNLYNKLHIKNVRELEAAAKKHKIQKLEGMGTKSEVDIITGIERMRRSAGRMLLGFAIPIAEDIHRKLSSLAYVKDVKIVGSYRRCKETIGDFDILVVSPKPKLVMDFFASMPNVKNIEAKGSTKTSVTLDMGMDADLRVFSKEEFGAAMLYFTGSKEHNILIRRLAMKKGWKLSEYGLFKGKKRIAGKTEQEVYRKLGMQYIPPEMREANGEIELAMKRKIPKLIELKDIRGDLQLHTTYSDGTNSIKEIAGAAKQRGYDYIAITDHYGSLKIAGAMTPAEARKQWKEINGIKSIHVLKGVEININKNGSLDMDKKLLDGFDIRLIAVHSSFKMPAQEQTKRLLKAVESGYANVLAHPMTRMIGKRDEIKFNIEKVFQACKDNKVALEIDAYPDRSDLRDVYLRIAKELGCKISMGTDAHNADSLRFMEIGVGMARRGWLEKKNIINTMTYSQLKKWLK
ncbi:MAG: DNA polymerase/3'-5' exonuclease PolX [Candidatus Aenigmatarchaeota archaeon]